MKKPRLFIGSSVEGLNIAYAIQENLSHSAEITVWDQGVFDLSDTSIESLISVIEKTDFGVFVFTPDDIITIRGKKNMTVRDNVLFELGLFIGKIGRKRSFIIMPDSCSAFHLPTDLLGITPGKYELIRSDNNFKAATGSCSNKIREAINKLGFIEQQETQTDTTTIDKKEDESKNEDWVEEIFVKKNYTEGIKILKRKARYSKDEDEKVQFGSYISYCELQLDYKKGLEEYEKLIISYPKNNIGFKNYAQTLMENNIFDDAIKIIDLGLSKCIRKIGLTILKAECFWLTGRKVDAIAVLNNSKEKTDPLICAKLVSYYSQNKDFDSAITVAKFGYKNNPKNVELLSEFARITFEKEDYDFSLFLFHELTLLSPENYYAWTMYGNCLFYKELYNSALNSYEKGNEITKEKEHWILENIGNLYSLRGLYSKAEFFLQKANKITNKSEYGLSKQSQIYKSIEGEKQKITEIIQIGKSKLSSLK
ncbi:MAG: nucleotide-binding protein [Bacteroidota bacterium]|nr:nucleotide-binding protein [Bacteroidota bacterium]